MSVDVQGKGNRVSGRDYQEAVIADSTIIGTQLNLGLPELVPLTADQRRRLNQLVDTISREHQVEAWALWKGVVHTRIGVSRVDQILRNQYAEAEQALLDHAEQLHAQAHAKLLAAELLDLANGRGLYQELVRWSFREHGHAAFDRMTPGQLKQALRFVENQRTAGRRSSFGAQLVELWSRYPLHSLVLVALTALVGRFIF